MTVLIQTNEVTKAYQMKPRKAKEIVKNIKSKFKGKNVILAIEKGSTMELRRDEYTTTNELLKATKEWIANGYKVYSSTNYLKV
ncbi:MAG: hypothetical protein ACK5KR_08995 [Breznakia sp.]